MDKIFQKANLLRKLSLISTTEAGSGHPTSCMSAADLMAVLFDSFFTFDLKNPLYLENDRLIFSKGHAAPLLYAMYASAGAIPFSLLRTLRKFDSPLEGHPTPNFKYAEAATGSLGQGLSVGAGMALIAKKDKLSFKTYVLLGDGEMAEGQVWEAANFASYYKLNNLIAIADVNRLGQSQQTMFGHKVSAYEDRFKAFGWKTIVINGHNFKEIISAYKKAISNKTDKPCVIIAKTEKGKGLNLTSNKDSWHGKPLSKEDLEKVLPQLGKIEEKVVFKLKTPRKVNLKFNVSQKNDIKTDYKLGDLVATREAYGKFLAKLGEKNDLIYALDGDTKNSTYSEKFLQVFPDRFIECFIAEQNMVSVCLGLARLEKLPFVSTFSAFFTRAFDQIRMAEVSKGNIKFVGSHAGVAIGQDGASQMGLEDIAMFGVIPGSLVFHPCDGVSIAKILPLILNHTGISYIRTLRSKTPVIYDEKEKFEIGGSKILKQSAKDILTVVGCGTTLHEALKAYETLSKAGIAIRVVDCYSIKPIDAKTLKACLKETKKQIIITVEDHFEHGGMGDFVLSALSDSDVKIYKMAVKKTSRSGEPSELLADAGIDAQHIIEKVKSLI